MTFEPIWGMPIVWYLFLAGLGAGIFIAAAFVGWKYPEAKATRSFAYIVAPIVVAVGLVCLIVDSEAGFHNPVRFFYLLTNFHSVMTWGVVFLCVFMIVAIIALVFSLIKKEIPSAIDVVGVIASLCVAVYTGVLLGVCNPFPLWNNAVLPVLFLVSAVSTGFSLVLLVSALCKAEEFNQLTLLKQLHFFLPLAEVVLIASLLFITNYNSVAGAQSVAAIISGDWAMCFWLGLVLIGLVLPCVLEARLLFFNKKENEEDRKSCVVSALASTGVLVGGFILRLVIVMAAAPLATIVAVL